MRIVHRTINKTTVHKIIQGITVLRSDWKHFILVLIVESPYFLSIDPTTNGTGYGSNMYAFITSRLPYNKPDNRLLKGRQIRVCILDSSNMWGCHICGSGSIGTLNQAGRLSKYIGVVPKRWQTELTWPRSAMRVTAMDSSIWKYSSCGSFEALRCVILMYRLLPNVLRAPVMRTHMDSLV